jgi:2-oxoisovalerate dehydrogenase E2 component (dihydrolipoyl transacylase)
MPTLKSFALPDLGEGLTEGEVLAWLVDVGDTVALNQPIVEVETAKAAVEVPSPYAGRVVELHCAPGETVEVGHRLLTVDVDPAGTPEEPTRPVDAALAGRTHGDDLLPPTVTTQRPRTGPGAEGGRTAVLVGYGPRSTEAQRRPRKDRPPPTPPPAAGGAVLARPPVRKRARDLGIDLSSVRGSGPGGTVTRGDVEAAASNGQRAPGTPADRRVPVKGVRKAMAEAMVASAFTAPHVTVFLTVDVTAGMEALARLAARPELDGVRASPLLLTAKALLLAVRRSPEVNASWDEAASEVVVRSAVHLGIAVDTPRGLVVPVLRDADRLSLPDLARGLTELARTAREGRTAPADLQGGTISITNVGSFGVDNGTPILVPGQAAILCLGAVRPRPWVVDGEIAVRQVTQLALSFDHRLLDGASGSRFLADVGAVLADPVLALVWS